MMRSITTSALLFFALCAAVPAQQAAGEPGSLLRLRYQSFDPLRGEPPVQELLQSNAGQRLWIVQFAGLPTEIGRAAIRSAGGEVHWYLPDHAYVVRMDAAAATLVGALPMIRWVGAYHAAYRLEPELLQALAAGSLAGKAQYHIVVVDKHQDKARLAGRIQAIGGRVENEQTGSILFTVSLDGAQLAKAAHFDEVLWIDRVTPDGEDMDNARIQGGGNYIEAQAGYTGTGVNAHIYEGVEATHPDFTGGVINVRSNGNADSHGHATAGIVFGNGTSNPAVRGMAPDAGKFFTQYGSVVGSRWQVISDLVNIHNVSHTTASWGAAQTTAYTSISAESDDIVFDHDITWTQSQSNTGNQNSRPQAWAKNVFSIGAVRHFDNSNPADDSYLSSTTPASRGPAADGRIKPDLCAYYDNIGTSDLSGSAGYSSGNWTATFGGTSGATPIVAGHNVLAIQMFTDDSATPGIGRFGNPLRVPNGTAHENRPHFTTVKALMVASAAQYAFTAQSADNRREHQGWGFPDLRKLWDYRNKTLVVDETDVLRQGEASRYEITVAPGETELRVVLNYAERAANPAAAKTLVNNLSLRVISPQGVVYWGNHGLEQGNWSLPGGVEDDTNPIECVFVQNPAAGVWMVDIKATLVAVDTHIETPEVDADYALVVSGGTGQRGIPPVFGSFDRFGQGCPGTVPLPSFCVTQNPNGGNLANNTRTWEYGYTVPNSGTAQVVSFDFFTRSTGGTQTIPAHIYAQVGGVPATVPLASTTLTVGPTAAFYTASFQAPVTVNGTFYLGVDTSAQTVLVSQLTAGSTGSGFYRTPVTGNWLTSALITRSSWRVSCAGAQFATPELGNQGLPSLGTNYNVTLAAAAPGAGALLLTGLSDAVHQGIPLPYALPGAPGCSVLVSPDSSRFAVASPTGVASLSFALPNSTGFLGVQFLHQWALFDAANPLGIVMSNAGRASIGD